MTMAAMSPMVMLLCDQVSHLVLDGGDAIGDLAIEAPIPRPPMHPHSIQNHASPHPA